MTRLVHSILLFAKLALLLWILLLFTGCKQAPRSNPSNIATGNAIAVTGANLALLPPHVDEPGKPILAAAVKSNDTAAKENNAQAATFDQVVSAHEKLQKKWYVWIGRWIERLFWIYILIAVGGRVLSLFGGPWGIAGNLLLKSTQVINPAVWGMSLQQKWMAGKANAGAGGTA